MRKIPNKKTSHLQQPSPLGRIEMRESEMPEGGKLSFEDVTIQTPNYERTLVKSLTFMAQSGKIQRPKPEDMLFVPRHAYMILGSLRTQLLYPNIEPVVPDEALLDESSSALDTDNEAAIFQQLLKTSITLGER